MYKVLKNDGSIQDFDWKKVTNGILMAGGTVEEADKVAESVELWLSTVADGDGIIKSNDLHIKVLETLRGINETAAKKFEEYRKPELK
jgi:transcriptional regulator NrdR family protein